MQLPWLHLFSSQRHIWCKTVWAGLCFWRHKPLYLLQHSQSPTGQLMPLALLMQYLAWICVTSMWEHKLERFPGSPNVSVQCHITGPMEGSNLLQYADMMGSLACTPSQIQILFSPNFLNSSDQDFVIDPASQNCNTSGFFHVPSCFVWLQIHLSGKQGRKEIKCELLSRKLYPFKENLQIVTRMQT